MSYINNIVERIADIELTVATSDAQRPYCIAAAPYQPSDISSIQCPFWVNEIYGGPSELTAAMGQQQIAHKVGMVLCIQRREGNTDLKYGVKETALWVSAVYSTFAQHLRLSDPSTGVFYSYVLDAWISSWDKLENYVYGSAEFLALRFTLSVREMYPVTIHS